ncbi:hypothetical protein PAMP_007372 [Pampus punctatissimus]
MHAAEVLNYQAVQALVTGSCLESSEDTAAMMKAGATKVGLPKLGLQERAKQASLAPSSSSTTSTAMKTSRSNMLASDHRLSRPVLGAAASGSRMKKTVTTGAISDLAEARPRSLSAEVIEFYLTNNSRETEKPQPNTRLSRNMCSQRGPICPSVSVFGRQREGEVWSFSSSYLSDELIKHASVHRDASACISTQP